MVRRRLPKPDGGIRVTPSLLASDFGRLADALAQAERAGADWVSVDVMDGHFVPNLSFGPDLIRALRPRTDLALDAHLMVEEPAQFLPAFADAGADLLIAHVEACADPRKWIVDLRKRGLAAGLALKPATSAEKLEPFVNDLDVALVMTVEPGFGGQEFREDMLPKIRALRKAVDRAGSKTWVMVDGGVNLETVALAAEAGADAFVAGSAVFKEKNPTEAFRALRQRAQEAFERTARKV